MAITSVDPNDPLLQWINQNAASALEAQIYLQGHGVTDRNDIAVYLAASTNTNVNPSAANNLNKNNNQSGMSLSTVLSILTAAGSAFGMLHIFGVGKLSYGTTALLQSVGKIVATGGLAAWLQTQVFKKAEEGGIAATAGLGAAATAATMLWLASFNHGTRWDDSATNAVWQDQGGMGLFSKLFSIIAHGHFSINPLDPFFYFTVATAGAITTAVALAGFLSGSNGAGGAISPTVASIKTMLGQLSGWYSALPPVSVAAITGGLMVGTASYSLSPTDFNKVVTVNTVQLNTTLASLGSKGGIPSLVISPDTGPKGSESSFDTVYAVGTGNGSTTPVLMIHVNKSGVAVLNQDASEACKQSQNPEACYLPIAQPTVDASGKVTGYKWNNDALAFMMNVQECTSIANNASLSSSVRENAIAACVNKYVHLTPLTGS